MSSLVAAVLLQIVASAAGQGVAVSPLRSGTWWNIVDRYHQRPYIASHCCNRDSGGIYYVRGINDRPGKPNPVTVKADAVWFRPWSAAAVVYLEASGATAVENTMVCLGMVARETALSAPCSGAGIFLQYTPVLAFMTRGTDGVRIMGVDYVRFAIPNENGY